MDQASDLVSTIVEDISFGVLIAIEENISAVGESLSSSNALIGKKARWIYKKGRRVTVILAGRYVATKRRPQNRVYFDTDLRFNKSSSTWLC